MRLMSRSQFLRELGLGGLALLAGADVARQGVRLLAAARARAASRQRMTVRVGYLPLTDAGPLLLAHALG